MTTFVVVIDQNAKEWEIFERIWQWQWVSNQYTDYIYTVQGGQKQLALSYKMVCQQANLSSFSNVGPCKGLLGLVGILNGGKNWLITS